ncbi:hypothetical protein CBM2592_A90615 [Cupriavidus taiwanensis]|nr:hypothetical protein CBM2588_A60520 [Cupriavidus taiwanensis]SOY57432.1 hypothetical protein CBM2592_A90615 [Cupriavidus taiwanensis]SOZ81001.1 hypothetical protein CBM2621_A100190 [Cupriavidus taiwanensis]SOZ85354.1 hypothetical protein CBM2622_A90208 [Cupriavidus taiwanensis]
MPGGDCINQGKDNRLAGFEGSWLHEWRLLLWFAATAMHRHPRGMQGAGAWPARAARPPQPLERAGSTERRDYQKLLPDL